MPGGVDLPVGRMFGIAIYHTTSTIHTLIFDRKAAVLSSFTVNTFGGVSGGVISPS